MFEYSYNSMWFNSPGYLYLEVPDEVKTEITKSIEQIENGECDVSDFRHKLAGNLQKETSFPQTENLKYLVETLCLEWEKIFNNKKCYHREPIIRESMLQSSWSYELDALWINYAYKNDYNPVHNHTGSFSFVIWVDVPFLLEDEIKVYKESESISQSQFSFHFTNPYGKLINWSIPVDKTWNWRMVLFPANLYHSVSPFKTSDKPRISISGNLFLKVNY